MSVSNQPSPEGNKEILNDLVPHLLKLLESGADLHVTMQHAPIPVNKGMIQEWKEGPRKYTIEVTERNFEHHWKQIEE